jgi:hypothetical protein
MHETVAVAQTVQYFLFLFWGSISFFAILFYLFADILSDLKSLYPYSQAISEFYSGCLKSKVQKFSMCVCAHVYV